MRKTAIALAILVALILAGLVLAPQFIDLNRFKGPIAAELMAQTGRPVEFRGPLGLSLLPGPRVTARDVRLANPPGAAVEDMVRLRAVEVKLAFWPLLAHRIEIRSATLVEPDIDVERMAGSDGNWRFDRPVRPGANGPNTPGPMMRALAIDHLTIENGAVTYRAANAVERFEHINATVAIQSGTGPYTASGDFVSRGAQLAFELRSGAVDAGQVPIEATVTVKPATRLQLDLIATGTGDERRIEGQLKLTASNAQTLAAMALRMRLPAALARPLALTADIRGTRHDIALEHLTLDFGTAHGEGSLHVAQGTPPSVALSLAVSQLDLDRWLAKRKAAADLPSSLFGHAFAATADAAAPMPLAPQQPDALVLPEGIDASVDLGVKALIWRDGVVRDARVKAGLTHGTLTLDRAAAQLPGGSDALLSGSIAMGAEGPHGQGTFTADADDLRGMLAWLGAPSGGVPADRLRKASLKTGLTLVGSRLELAGINATVDATTLSGAATVALRERPGIGLRLNADRFNLDAYLPADDAPPRPAGSGNPWPDLLTAFDANIEAHVDTLTWHGELLGDAHAAGTMQNGKMTIRDLSVGDIEGAAARVSGTVQGLGADPFAAQVSYEVHGPELERLLHLASPPLDPGHAYGEFDLAGDLRWAEETLSGTADLAVLGGRAHVAGSAAPASAHMALDIDIEHPSFAALVRSVSPSYRPAGGDVGALKLTGQATGGAGHFTLDHLSLEIGHSTATGRFSLDLDGVRPHLGGDLKLGDWAIDQFLSARQSAAIDRGLQHAGLRPGVILAQAGADIPATRLVWSHEPLDLAPLTLADADLTLSGNSVAYDRWRVDQPSVTVAATDGALAIKHLVGNLFGGSIAADGDITATTPRALHAKLSLRDVDLKQAFATEAGIGSIEGRLDGDASLVTAGGSPAEWIAGLSGDATLRAHDGAVAGIDLAAANEWLKVLDRPFDLIALIRSGLGGRTRLNELTGSFHAADGVIRSDDLHLAADGTAGQGVATFDLPRWTIASRLEFRLTGLPMAPPLGVQLEGPIDAPREVFDVNPLQRFLQQRQRAGDQPVTAPVPER